MIEPDSVSGSVRVAISLEPATPELDPNFAAAHLRYLVYCTYPPGPGDDSRRSFSVASQYRASLAERDAALLGVVEREVLPEAADHQEAARRARALASRWDHDAELAVVAGIRLAYAGDFDASLAELDRALGLDDHFAYALHERANVQAAIGDPDGELASAQRCLAISPAAASCARRAADVFAFRGQCEDLEREAKRAVAGEPGATAAYDYLAFALAARRAPVGAIRDVFENEPVPDAERPRTTAIHELALGIYSGNLGAGLESAIEDERLGRKKDRRYRGIAIVQLAEEVGDRSKAARTAEEFLRDASTTAPTDPEDVSAALSELRLARRITDAEFTRQRDAWVKVESAESAFGQDPRWIDFYARQAWTHEQALDALAALPRFPGALPHRVPEISKQAIYEEPIGRTYLLAGDLDGAVLHLRRATAGCAVLAGLRSRIVAHEELGEALAAKGDTAGACAELRTVLGYWGSAKPRSMTADRAGDRMRRLACPP